MKVHELNKPDNTWCQHCKIGDGCQIYETRPESCRVYECVWLQTQRGGKPLELALRPDISRVVIGTLNQGEDIVLYVSADRPDAWNRGEMGKLVSGLQARHIRVFISCRDNLQAIA